MKKTKVFEFDKIVLLRPNRPSRTIKEACYSTLPKAYLAVGALEELRKSHLAGCQNVLISTLPERLVKESLYIVGACQLFDELRITGEPR